MNKFKTLILSLGFIAVSNISFATDAIFQKTDNEVITKGVSHKTVTQFYSYGWQNINILTVDLTNPYIKFDVLTSLKGCSNLDTVLNLSKSRGAIGAINSDFFSKSSPSTGFGLGFAKSSDSIITSSYYENSSKNKLGTFSMDELGNVLYSYISTNIKLISPAGNSINISDINKSSSTYSSPVLYNKNWGKTSIGINESISGLVEMLVIDNKVVEVYQNSPAVNIPDNGYVITASGTAGQFLLDNFRPNDTAVIDIKSSADLSSMNLAISGGTILVKDGQVASFTHNITGIHPRSAVATSKDGKTLYLVAVDGRQISSVGMTQDDFAKYLISIGCYNALNFDGGSSTQIVGRQFGDDFVSVLNSPSEKPYRKVVNALGVFSTAPKSPLSNLLIKCEDNNIFINTTRPIIVTGYDQYSNPVNLDIPKLKFKVTGVKGTFKGNIFKPTTIGEGTITVSYGKIKSTYRISVLSEPKEMDIYPRNISLTLGQSANLRIFGRNKNGFGAIINPNDLKWTMSNNIGTIDVNTFKSANSGASILCASFNKTKAYCGISVSEKHSDVTHSFEVLKASYTSYPSTVLGSFDLSTEQKHNGSFSGKLAYDFTNVVGSKAAYILFDGGGFDINDQITDIGVWVYNDSLKPDSLKAQIVDSTGGMKLVELSKTLNWTGWKEIKVTTDNWDLPAKLTRIYVVQTNPSAGGVGQLYFDDLTYYSNNSYKLDRDTIPQNTRPVDESNKYIKPTKSSIKFSVSSWFNFSNNKPLMSSLNSANVSAVLGNPSDTLLKKIKNKPYTFDKYYLKSYKNTSFMILDNSVDGLRKTDKDQWKWFIDNLYSVKSSNLFIMLPKPLDTFNDDKELDLFKNILNEFRKKKQTNIVVLFADTQGSYKLENKIKYMGIGNEEYASFNINSKNITYQIRK